ncbi:MAG: prepilin-type N-terminal cleavage/methylation domain-containing protein [Planctomycetota bacterium]
MQTLRRCHVSSVRRRGFTLTELLISIVLVLLLVVAIARIFGTTSETIGRSEAVTQATLGLEAVRTSLQSDFAGTDSIAFGGRPDTSGMLPVPGLGAERGDFTGSQTPQPAIILYSSRVGTFLSQAEAEAEADFDLNAPLVAGRPDAAIYTVDRDGDGADDTTLSRFQYGQRSFRTDTLSFFSGGSFKSQANLVLGDEGVTDFESDQAWVWWGHGRAYNGLVEPNVADGYSFPGFIQTGTVAGNPNNRFANEFRLLRAAMLLAAPVDHDGDDPTGDDGTATSPTVVNAQGVPLIHFAGGDDTWSRRIGLYPIRAGDWRLLPALSPDSILFTDTTFLETPVRTGFTETSTAYLFNTVTGTNDVVFPPVGAFELTGGRSDVIGASAEQLHDQLLAQAVAQPRVHLPLLTPEGGVFDDGSPGTTPATVSNWAEPWYDDMLSVSANGNSATAVPNRYYINPIVRSPVDPTEVTQRSKLLLDGAAQFTVEFAGDFFTQDSNPASNTFGDVTADGPDGQLDFYAEEVPTGATVQRFRRTRFYGLPRDINGDNLVRGPAALTLGANGTTRRDPDVRPAADYVIGVLPASSSAGLPTTTRNHGFPFEKLLPGRRDSDGNHDRLGIEDYLAEARGDSADAREYEDEWSQYVCAWGPMELASKPTLTTAATPVVIEPNFFGSAPYNDNVARNYPAGSPWESFNEFDRPLSPRLFRFIVEATDGQGRLDQAVQTELVFAVPHRTN